MIDGFAGQRFIERSAEGIGAEDTNIERVGGLGGSRRLRAGGLILWKLNEASEVGQISGLDLVFSGLRGRRLAVHEQGAGERQQNAGQDGARRGDFHASRLSGMSDGHFRQVIAA